MPHELKGHLEALRCWIDRQGDIPSPNPDLSDEEREHLRVLNKSIQQLAGLGVSIPDDLRELKLRLSAKDNASQANPEIENRLAEVEDLVEHLRELTQAARSLRDRLKATGRSPGTKKHYGVSLKELLQSGHLSTDDKLELQWSKNGSAYEGKVRDDGTVMARTNDGWKQFDTLSAAAVSISERPTNGWNCWRRVNRNGSRTMLKDIRAKFISEGDVS